ncbi:MAG: glycosyltransferase family 39 protein [Candidatus Kapaibacterium sp.]
MKQTKKQRGKSQAPSQKAMVSVTSAFERRDYLLAALCAVVAFALYANTFSHDYVLDDQAAITKNLYVQQGFGGIPKLLTVDFWHFSGLRLGYYRPLPLITYAVEHQFFGLNPHVGHFTNVLLFALTSFFVFLLMRRLVGGHIFLALSATLVFAAHPIHTEVVNNIKSRDELLSFLGLVLTLFFVLRHIDSRRTIHLAGAVISVYLAMLCKESAFIIIALVPFLYWQYGKIGVSQTLRSLLPFGAAILVYLIQRAALFETTQTIIPRDMINYPYLDSAVRLSSMCMIFLHSVGMLLYPWPLRYDYSYNQIPAVTWADPSAIGGLALLIGLSVAALLLLRRTPKLGYALLLVLIPLVPALGFVAMRGGIFAERFLFAPSLGFCLALVLVLDRVASLGTSTQEESASQNTTRTGVVLAVSVLAAGVFGTMTFQRNPAWKDPYTLYSTDVITGRQSAQNHLHMGLTSLKMAYEESDKSKKADLIAKGQASINEALRVHPTFGDAMFYAGYAYELKAVSEDIRYVDSAMFFFQRATVYAPMMDEPYIHLGDIYKWMQRNDAASYCFNQAVRVNPSNEVARQKAAMMRQQFGLGVNVKPF